MREGETRRLRLRLSPSASERGGSEGEGDSKTTAVPAGGARRCQEAWRAIGERAADRECVPNALELMIWLRHQEAEEFGDPSA